MTDHNFTNLPTLDLLGMLYSAQANYVNAKSDRSRGCFDVQGREGRSSRPRLVSGV